MESPSVEYVEQTLEEWRAMMFEELGFDQEEAAKLALAQNDDGSPVTLNEVTKLVESGCPHELVLRIVL